MLVLLTLCVVLVILFLGAILGGFVAIGRKDFTFKLPPFAPVIHVHVGEMRILLPEPKPVVAEVIHNEPIPDEVIEYIDQESEEHARSGRRNKAHSLKEELGDWDAVLRALVREDTLT